MLWVHSIYLEQKAGLWVKGESLGAGQPEEGGVVQVHICSKGAESGVGAAGRALQVVEGVDVPALEGCAALQRRLLLHGRPEALHPCTMLQLFHNCQMIRTQYLARYHSEEPQPGAPPGLQRVLMPGHFEVIQGCSITLGTGLLRFQADGWLTACGLTLQGTWVDAGDACDLQGCWQG